MSTCMTTTPYSVHGRSVSLRPFNAHLPICLLQILVPATTPKYAAPGTPAIGTAGGTIGGAGGFGSPAEVPQFGSTAPYGPQAALASQELMLRLPAGQQLPGTPITQVHVWTWI